MLQPKLPKPEKVVKLEVKSEESEENLIARYVDTQEVDAEKEEEAKNNFMSSMKQKNSRNLDRLISENNKKGQRNNSVPS